MSWSCDDHPSHLIGPLLRTHVFRSARTVDHSLDQRSRLRIGGILLTHGVIDFFSYVIVPIVTLLEGRVHLSHEQGAFLLGLGSIASGAIQPLVAWISDRYHTRMPGWIGFVLAVLAISLVGHATQYWHLLLIQIIGSAGVGAYHPVAAAVVGQLSGPRRLVGMSAFFAAGMTGGILGNWTTPAYVNRLGIESLLWLIPPGLLAAWILWQSMRNVEHGHIAARAAHAELTTEEQRARWRGIWLLYTSNVLRFIVNMMLVQLAIRWSEQAILHRNSTAILDDALRTKAIAINGPLQASMQVGMGFVGLAIALLAAKSVQRQWLLWTPIACAIPLFLFPSADAPTWAAFLVLTIAGAGFGGTYSISVSMGQQLLPHRTNLASGLLMGGAWGVAFLGPPLAQWILDHSNLRTAFVSSGVLLLISGALIAFLPRQAGSAIPVTKP